MKTLNKLNPLSRLLQLKRPFSKRVLNQVRLITSFEGTLVDKLNLVPSTEPDAGSPAADISSIESSASIILASACSSLLMDESLPLIASPPIFFGPPTPLAMRPLRDTPDILTKIRLEILDLEGDIRRSPPRTPQSPLTLAAFESRTPVQALLLSPAVLLKAEDTLAKAALLATVRAIQERRPIVSRLPVRVTGPMNVMRVVPKVQEKQDKRRMVDSRLPVLTQGDKALRRAKEIVVAPVVRAPQPVPPLAFLPMVGPVPVADAPERISLAAALPALAPLVPQAIVAPVPAEEVSQPVASGSSLPPAPAAPMLPTSDSDPFFIGPIASTTVAVSLDLQTADFHPVSPPMPESVNGRDLSELQLDTLMGRGCAAELEASQESPLRTRSASSSLPIGTSSSNDDSGPTAGPGQLGSLDDINKDNEIEGLSHRGADSPLDADDSSATVGPSKKSKKKTALSSWKKKTKGNLRNALDASGNLPDDMKVWDSSTWGNVVEGPPALPEDAYHKAHRGSGTVHVQPARAGHPGLSQSQAPSTASPGDGAPAPHAASVPVPLAPTAPVTSAVTVAEPQPIGPDLEEIGMEIETSDVVPSVRTHGQPLLPIVEESPELEVVGAHDDVDVEMESTSMTPESYPRHLAHSAPVAFPAFASEVTLEVEMEQESMSPVSSPPLQVHYLSGAPAVQPMPAPFAFGSPLSGPSSPATQPRSQRKKKGNGQKQIDDVLSRLRFARKEAEEYRRQQNELARQAKLDAEARAAAMKLADQEMEDEFDELADDEMVVQVENQIMGDVEQGELPAIAVERQVLGSIETIVHITGLDVLVGAALGVGEQGDDEDESGELFRSPFLLHAPTGRYSWQWR